jgi:hypothetical protein
MVRISMRGLGVGLLVLGVLALGCGGESSKASSSGGGESSNGGSSGGDDPPNLPQFVQIEILDAMIYPSPKNGECWDGSYSINPEDLGKLADALAGPYVGTELAEGVASVLAGIVNHVLDASAPPDPIASAMIWDVDAFVSPIDLSYWLNNYDDTYTPTWHGDEAYGNAKGWTKVPLNKDLRIRVHIDDEDLKVALDSDDPIGEVEINYDDVVAAYLKKQSYPVRVDDQGSGLILFVGISVQGL